MPMFLPSSTSSFVNALLRHKRKIKIKNADLSAAPPASPCEVLSRIAKISMQRTREISSSMCSAAPEAPLSFVLLALLSHTYSDYFRMVRANDLILKKNGLHFVHSEEEEEEYQHRWGRSVRPSSLDTCGRGSGSPSSGISASGRSWKTLYISSTNSITGKRELCAILNSHSRLVFVVFFSLFTNSELSAFSSISNVLEAHRTLDDYLPILIGLVNPGMVLLYLLFHKILATVILVGPTITLQKASLRHQLSSSGKALEMMDMYENRYLFFEFCVPFLS